MEVKKQKIQEDPLSLDVGVAAGVFLVAARLLLPLPLRGPIHLTATSYQLQRIL